jgi:trimeric autotransporter adhesin
MRKLCLSLLLIICSSSFLLAQNVGINTDGSNPDISAMLDVKSPNKGILIPRVALSSFSDVTTIPSPQISLVVYNTATVGTGITALTPGFYFWNGTSWVNVLSSVNVASYGWALTGNSGINPATNFIGTIDNQPLIFKVSNAVAGKMDVSTGSTFFGIQSGLNNTGINNTGVGINALVNSTNMYGNTALGAAALYTNINGFAKTALGQNADVGGSGLNNATAIGYRSRVDCSNCLVLGSVNGLNQATIMSELALGQLTLVVALR